MKSTKLLLLAPALIPEDFRRLGAHLGLFYGWCSPPRPNSTSSGGAPDAWFALTPMLGGSDSARFTLGCPHNVVDEHTKHKLLRRQRVRDRQQL